MGLLLISVIYFQILKNAKSLKSDKTLDQCTIKITQLEKELTDALAKIKNYENNKDDKSDKKVRFGGDTNLKDKDSIKSKQEELDRLKQNYNKVI